MGKKTTAFFLILFLSAAAFADVFDRQFNVDYQSLPAPAYASTNISIAPSITPSTIVKCTGSTYSPSLSLSTAYVVPAYEGHLANDVLVGSYSSCLVPYTTLSPNQPINWVTNSQYASLAATNWYSSSAAFQSVVPGMLQSDERSQYMNPLTGQPFVVGGDNRFDARIGLFCTASVELVSSTNPSFNQMVASQYTGQALTVPSLTLPSSPSTVQIAQRVNVTHCIASGRTVLNPSCSSYETVWMYHSSAFPVSTTSAPISISVQNPFACNLAATVFSPMAMNNSTTYSFSLTVKNNGDSVNVNSISIVQPSGFSALSITSPALPTTIAAGATQVFSGSVKAPAAIGMQTLTVQISSVSSLPNCTGSTANCNLVASFAINITNSSTSGTPASCSLALDGHGANFIPQDGTDVIATCLSGSGATVPCGTLGWSTTATGGTMSPTSTVSPPQASLSNFNINAVSAPQPSANVKAQGTGFSCSLPLSVAAPDYTSAITAPASALVGTVFNASVETSNIGAAANLSTVTRLIFNGATQSFGIAALGSLSSAVNNATLACPSAPGLYLINSTADATGALTESSETNNFDSKVINCTTAQMPDYTSHIIVPAFVPVGSSFTAYVNTTNIGNAASQNSSRTRLAISGLPSVFFRVRPLSANGDFITNSTNITCSSAGTLTLISSADFDNNVSESNENNNNFTALVTCGIASLPNYIPTITAPSVAFVGVPFGANFTTTNIGSLSAAVSSITHAAFQSSALNFTVAPLQPGASQSSPSNFTCSSTGVKSMVETVDYTNVISESNEADNVQNLSITCVIPPTSCNLSFTGPDSTPFVNAESSGVTASCYASGAQTACPAFLWQQSANGSFMSPVNTPSAFNSNSTLIISNTAPIPQIGMKVNATSTMAGVPLYCELPFDISSVPVGPDYNLTFIHPDPPSAFVGQIVQFSTRVDNVGNVNATNDSTSVASYSSGCTPITSSYFLPRLDVGAFDLNGGLSCMCNTMGQQTITVEANPSPHPQYESTYSNNVRTVTFICKTTAQLITCSYFV